ncbi:uncharacterized protein Z519_05446 [Cladophialophora bantiana CBS 173.52]|uniref:Major facilitator superfamily (MFS) profile domain-containing protein n=1 Tax=Cladophialophora bantiana (strain ATCC 10958 / CBS 173.52 / CDC B-1940 / NIH 8579) TaxID=1442370 RepID=A0A0D2HTG3_CLAB1|nr:uncharacterized protein Z519_05446 [Cladophialophora bantiana CBS 173.52]KIW94130.1 hypothetical protein Z519_05446 [Cladophialophora bantiana CBS 173.52]
MNISVGMQEKDMSPEHMHVEGVEAEEQLKHAELKEALDAEGGVDKHLEKKLRWKVDRRLLPLCGALYAVSLIDRLNLPNARLAGMDAALGLSIGNRYSILTMAFFIGYIICDFPANFVMRKVGPASFLGTIGFCWGVLTIGMGFCKTWGELLLCRIIFGMFEGGLFPGLIYLLSCWYVRHEVQVRFSGFYGAGMLVSGLSNLLAYGLSKANGLSGLGGWSWIFIFGKPILMETFSYFLSPMIPDTDPTFSAEGITTCVVAIVVLVFLIDFPDKAVRPSKLGFRRFQTPNEATVILARIERDRGDAIPEKFSPQVVFNHLKDWKIWEYCVLLLCNNTVAYSFAYFLPLILHSGMGYSIPMTYTLIFPPYVLAAIWMFIAAYIGDRFMIRGPIIVFNAI